MVKHDVHEDQDGVDVSKRLEALISAMTEPWNLELCSSDLVRLPGAKIHR